MLCVTRDSKAVSSIYDALANFAYSAANSVLWRSDVNNVLLVADVGVFTVIAINLTTNAMTVDSTYRNFDTITEDASGVIWANAINAGYYGLWKRTAAGSWTQVLSDSGAGKVRRWIDDKVYYRSSVGNWYECTGGTAVVSANPTTGSPSTYYDPWINYTGYGYASNDTVFNYQLGASPLHIPGLGTLPTPATHNRAAAETNSARYWPINAAGNYAGTVVAPISDINWETLTECTQANIPNATTDLQLDAYAHKFIRLDSTYMLHVVSVKLNTTAATRQPNIGSRKLILTILNKTTGVNKYIGSLFLTGASTTYISATEAALIRGNVVGARLTSGVLDLWIAQGTFTTEVSTDIYGLFKKSLTLNLDF